MYSERIELTRMTFQRKNIVAVLMCLLAMQTGVWSIAIENAAYKDIVIEIKDYVPVERCSQLLSDIEVSQSQFRYLMQFNYVSYRIGSNVCSSN